MLGARTPLATSTLVASRPDAVLLAVAIVVLILGASTAASIGLGLPIPGGVVEVPARFLAARDLTRVNVAMLFVTYIGLALASVSFTIVAARTNSKRARAFLAGLAVLALVHAIRLIAGARELEMIEGFMRTLQAIPDPPASRLVYTAGWLAIACAVLTIAAAVAPRTLGLRWTGLVAGVGAGSFLTAIPLIWLGDYGSIDTGAPPGWPTMLAASAIVPPALLAVSSLLQSCLLPAGLWQAMSLARGARREVGESAASLVRRRPQLLGLFVGAKLPWLALGYLGVLPPLLGGASGVWAPSLADGAVAWLIAAAIAGGIAAWLVRRKSWPISDDGFSKAALLIVVGFSLIPFATSLATVGLVLAELFILPREFVQCDIATPSRSFANSVHCSITALLKLEGSSNAQLWSWVATLMVTGLVGMWLARRASGRSAALFLLAFTFWSLPRIAGVVSAIIDPDRRISIAPEIASLDSAVTVAVAVLAAAWLAGKRTQATPEALTLVLVVSTLVAHATTLIPVTLARDLFILGLLLPVAYEFAQDIFRSAGRIRIDRLGLYLVSVSAVLLAVSLGITVRGGSALVDSGFFLMVVPFAIVIVGARLSRVGSERNAEDGADRAPRSESAP